MEYFSLYDFLKQKKKSFLITDFTLACMGLDIRFAAHIAFSVLYLSTKMNQNNFSLPTKF